MKKAIPLLLQVAIWLSLWSVFSFAGNAEEKLPMYYVVTTLRVLGYALFYNVAYYALLPLYVTGKKRAFYILSPLAFAAYIAQSATLDLTLGRPEKMIARTQRRDERSTKERPLAWILIPPIFIGTAIFGAASAFRGFAAYEDQKKAEEVANRRRLEAEIALLKSQINPHFLLNTLNNLYTLALTEPEKTPGALLKLSEMVAYILYECAQPNVPLASDLAFIENYIALQRLRLPPNVSLRTELPTDVPADSRIEPMILIPFIENAFKHGLTTRQSCEIDIAIRLDGNRLSLRVNNPLLPAKPPQNGQPSGMGMANTRQRLEHAYPDSHRLHVGLEGAEHRVELNLVLH